MEFTPCKAGRPLGVEGYSNGSLPIGRPQQYFRGRSPRPPLTALTIPSMPQTPPCPENDFVKYMSADQKLFRTRNIAFMAWNPALKYLLWTDQSKPSM
jgi:hypothetical protein